MSYVLTHLEDFIRKLYHRAGIYTADAINDLALAKVWGLTVLYAPLPSIYFHNTIVVNNAVVYRREEFAHELCHATWHSGNQMYMPKTWLCYQECGEFRVALLHAIVYATTARFKAICYVCSTYI